jgi:uncharacterized protein YjbI with pentapeptide repeats
MNRGKLAKTLFLGLGLALLADPLAGYAQAEELNAEELYNLCSRFPFNSSCEGYEVPIALADRPGSRISCSLALNNPATSDRCKLLVTDEQLTLYFEYGDRVSFLNDSRATEEIPIPFTNILALNLRLWRYELDAFSIFFGGNYYVLDDTEYENLNSNFDPANNSNERGAVGERNFVEIELDFIGAPDNGLGNQTNILQIATTENFGNYLRIQLEPILADASLETLVTRVQTSPEATLGTLTQTEQLQQLINTRVCVRCDLQGVDLSQADLGNANLEGTNLTGANLTEANLENAYLVGATLNNATLTNANLNGAILTLASLVSVNAEEISLEGASLQNANLQGAILTNGRFSGADLEGANLENASLENAGFNDSTRTRSFIPFLGIQRFNYYTSARRSNLQGANLSNANLDHASLSRANLSNADLTEASLNETNFSGADLTDAVLSEDIPDNVGLCNATLPDGTISQQNCP